MATAYLDRTLGSGNKDKWTFSCWVKRHKTGVIHPLLHADDNSSNYYTHISFHDTDQLFFQNRWNNGNDGYKITTRMFRDTNAWYHLQFVWDSGNATADDRQIIYVNGERLTEFGGANVAVTQDRNTTINDGYEHRIGRGDTGFNSSQYADITLTHVHFTDGYAYAPTVFGETDSTSGIWKPKTSPSVTYGTNGFFLKMENSGAMGTDSSGNSNTFTVSGSLTQNVDTPSNNFATFNSLISNNPTLSGANLIATASGGYRYALSTIAPTTGKYYAEFKLTTDSGYTNFGVENISKGSFFSQYNTNSYIGDSNSGVAYQPGSSSLYYNGSSSGSYGGAVSGDIIGIAMDLDNGFIYWSKNGTFLNSGVPTSAGTGTGGYAISNIANSAGENTYAMGVSLANTGGGRSISANFGSGFFGTTAISSEGSNASGNGKFEYDVPTGYTALSTKGLNE